MYVVSRKEFDAINEASDPVGFRKIMQDGDRIGGFYDVNRNAIVLPSDASTTGLQEEFGHAFMLPIINGQANPELQQELFNELTNNIKSRLKGDALSRFNQWKEAREARYENKNTPQYREEMIIGFFKHYKDNQKDFKGIYWIHQASHQHHSQESRGTKESFLFEPIVSYLTSQRLTLR